MHSKLSKKYIYRNAGHKMSCTSFKVISQWLHTKGLFTSHLFYLDIGTMYYTALLKIAQRQHALF